jgi:hypothetical protein
MCEMHGSRSKKKKKNVYLLLHEAIFVTVQRKMGFALQTMGR